MLVSWLILSLVRLACKVRSLFAESLDVRCNFLWASALPLLGFKKLFARHNSKGDVRAGFPPTAQAAKVLVPMVDPNRFYVPSQADRAPSVARRSVGAESELFGPGPFGPRGR